MIDKPMVLQVRRNVNLMRGCELILMLLCEYRRGGSSKRQRLLAWRFQTFSDQDRARYYIRPYDTDTTDATNRIDSGTYNYDEAGREEKSDYKDASDRSLKLMSRSRSSSGISSRFSSSLTLLPLLLLEADPLRRLSPPKLNSPAAAASSLRSSSSMAALIIPTRISSFRETSSTSDLKERKRTSA